MHHNLYKVKEDPAFPFLFYDYQCEQYYHDL